MLEKGKYTDSNRLYGGARQYSAAEGLGSRVARRQDIHHPEVPGDKFVCADQTVATIARIVALRLQSWKPIVDAAFTGRNRRETKPLCAVGSASKAALLWFFYLSPLSEEWTSTFDDIEDVDSAWVTNGGTDRGVQSESVSTSNRSTVKPTIGV